MKYLEKIKSLLPLGYLYLITLGLLKETILCYPLGINILNYSSLTDILIIPISDLTSSTVLLIAILIPILILCAIAQIVLVKHGHKNWVRQMLAQYGFNHEPTKREIQKIILTLFTLCVAIELLGLFVTSGLRSGGELSKKISTNNYEYNYKIDFKSGEFKDVYVFHLNSSYYFYVTKGNKNIKIAPIGSINSIELINNKRLK